MVHGDFKDLGRRIASDTASRDNEFKFASN